MQVLKLVTKTESKIRLAEITIKLYCLLKNIEINDKMCLILSYYMVYGFSNKTKELMLRSQIMKNPVSIDNILSKLRDKGLVVKVDVGLKTERGRDSLCPDLNFAIKDQLGIIIKLENV